LAVPPSEPHDDGAELGQVEDETNEEEGTIGDFKTTINAAGETARL
jgi:hypothetical protein